MIYGICRRTIPAEGTTIWRSLGASCPGGATPFRRSTVNPSLPRHSSSNRSTDMSRTNYQPRFGGVFLGAGATGTRRVEEQRVKTGEPPDGVRLDHRSFGHASLDQLSSLGAVPLLRVTTASVHRSSDPGFSASAQSAEHDQPVPGTWRSTAATAARAALVSPGAPCGIYARLSGDESRVARIEQPTALFRTDGSLDTCAF